MQLRFRHVTDFDRWWQEVCDAAEMMGIKRLALPLEGRDGNTRILRWDAPDAGPADDAEKTLPFTATVPVRHRRMGPPIQAMVEVGSGESLENAARRLTVFTRLLDEHSIASLPNTPINDRGRQSMSYILAEIKRQSDDHVAPQNGKGHSGNGNGHAHGNGNGHGHGNGNGHGPIATQGTSEKQPGTDFAVLPQPAAASEPVAKTDKTRTNQSNTSPPIVLPSGSAGRWRFRGKTVRRQTVAGATQGGEASGAISSLNRGDLMRDPQTKIAVVHDFLYCYAGAEKVLEQILHVFPDADLFSLFDFLPKKERGFLQGKQVQSSFIQRLPLARTKHRHYLPLMPLAIEQLDVSKYDVVISSSYLAAKGVITGPDQLHICYCHSPVRYAWDLQHQYLAQSNLTRGLKSMLARWVLHYIRTWDTRTSNGVDHFLSNSNFVGRRIEKVYRRESTTIYPPVDTRSFKMEPSKDEFYLTTSRLVPYKKVDVIVEAFNRMPNKRLIVIGEGPEFEKIKTMAGSNVRLLGHQPHEALREYMQRARAFVFAAEEDFGIVPVEAQACGTPVIAYGHGGVTESVIPGRTGIFFGEQTPECLARAVQEFERVDDWDAAAIRQNAERFSTERFREQFTRFVQDAWAGFRVRQLESQEESFPGAADMDVPELAKSEPRKSRNGNGEPAHA
jgi:glycosyltransferase involved in cell wall biosynthesis